MGDALGRKIVAVAPAVVDDREGTHDVHIIPLQPGAVIRDLLQIDHDAVRRENGYHLSRQKVATEDDWHAPTEACKIPDDRRRAAKLLESPLQRQCDLVKGMAVRIVLRGDDPDAVAVAVMLPTAGKGNGTSRRRRA